MLACSLRESDVGVGGGGSIALGEVCNVLSVSGRVEDALPNDCCNNEQSATDSSSFFCFRSIDLKQLL